MGTVRHRHPSEGGYQRGEETRARIVTAALRLFGEQGFEGASTRDIATAAEVSLPALRYYFDNKEGVYLACVEHLLACIWGYLAETIAEGERLAAQNADDEALIEAYCAIQARLADFMFTAPEAHAWRLFMARHQAGSGPVAGVQIASRQISQRISGTTSAIVSRLLGKSADDDETLIRTAALSGQLSLFQLARGGVSTSIKWDSVDAARLAMLKRVVREQTKDLLRFFVAKRGARLHPDESGGTSTSASPSTNTASS